jgi:predicted anti-sigma-YlaC factor YlaD
MAMTLPRDTLQNACSDFEEDLVLHYYGDGSEAERKRVETHLQECAPCRTFLQDLARLLPRMAKPNELPQSFWDNYYRETLEKLAAAEERKFRWRNLFAPMHGWMLPAFGTAAVAVFAVALVLTKGHWNFSLKQSGESIPQEILVDTNQLEFFKSMDMLEALSKLEKLDGTKLETVRSHQLG